MALKIARIAVKQGRWVGAAGRRLAAMAPQWAEMNGTAPCVIPTLRIPKGVVVGGVSS